MNDTPADAPWHHLPDDPEAFFGLEPEYDRKALRRAYNTMLRRFKPERFPDEFQRVRAAYEELDAALRYGRSRPSAPPARPASASTSEPDERADDETRADAWCARLTATGVDGVLAGIVDAPASDPVDLYARAVLSDLDERDTCFGRTLAEAISRDPQCELIGLFHAYAREESDPAVIESTLRGFGPDCPPDLYYFLSEALWIKLGRTIEFERWRTLLAECERGRRVTDESGRVAFTLTLIRAMVFRADPKWIDEQIEWTEQYGTRISDSQEFDLEMTIRLRDYQNRRAAATPTDETSERLRGLVHDVLVAYAEADEAEVDRAFLSAQQELGESSDQTLRAFPFADTVFTPVYPLYCTITREVGWRLHDENPFDDDVDQAMSTGVVNLLRRIERLTDRSFVGRIRNVGALAYLGTLVIGYMLAFVCAAGAVRSTFGKDTSDWIRIIAGLVAIVIYHVVIKRKVLGPIFKRFTYRMARKSYVKIWRREAAHYIRDTHANDLQLAAAIHSQNTLGITNDEMMYLLLQQDLGIGFYSIAVRFVG